MRWGPSVTNIWGSRMYLQYTGGPPSTADLNTFCTNVFNHYVSAGFPVILNSNIFFQEVTAVDLSSDTGEEGIHTGTVEGSDTGTVPEDVCINMQFDIGRRYRGGKPRIYLPPAGSDSLADDKSWSSALVAAASGAWTTFFTAILADTYATFSPQRHVNVSYYKGFTVFTTPSGRARNIPTLRSSPVVDPVESHTVRELVGSQRRRRTAISG